MDLLFVYGTLRSEFSNRYARALHRQAEFIGCARVRGRLYNLGRYPGLRSGMSEVLGEVYRLRGGRLLTVLDAWEGSDYRRVRTRARLADGRVVAAWVYEYRAALPEWRRIASGDFVER